MKSTKLLRPWRHFVAWIRELISKRSKLVLVIVFIVLSMAFLQLVYLQVIDGPKLAKEALDNRTYRYELQAKRGDILDRNGMVLATSVVRYNLGVNQILIADYVHKEYVDSNGNVVTDPKKQNDPGVHKKVVGTGAAEVARLLAPLLKQDRVKLGGKMIGHSTFEYIAKDVDPITYRKIRELNIHGIEPEQIMKREYPNGATAASIIGFVNDQGIGSAGIEQTENSVLAGTPGYESLEISAGGQVIPGGTYKTKEPVDGSAVKLTIDADLNQYAEQQVNDAVDRYNGQWGTAVVLDVKTGQVLAIADSHNENPDKPRKEGEFWGSRAVEDSYEPGSTAKLVTFAAALNTNKITPTDYFTCPNPYETPDGEKIKDALPHPPETLTASGVLAQSLNSGTVQIGSRVPDEERYDIMKKFGFGTKTGIELPGEADGILAPPDKWEKRQRYTMMFGQGVSTTPLQVAQMAAAIANNGVRISPRIVDSIISPAGAVTKEDKGPATQVMNQDVAKELQRMMLTAADGYGRMAKIDGYQVGFKTGTAQVYINGRESGIAGSAVAVAPVQDPRIAVMTVNYRPTSGLWGQTTALPYARNITEQALRILKIAPPSENIEPYPTH